MFTTPLSPVLAESFHTITEGCICTVQVSDRNSLNDYLVEKALRHLSRGTSCLFVIPDNVDSSIISKALSRFQLSSYVASSKGIQPISKTDTDRINILSQIERIPETVDLDDIEIEYHRVSNKIKSILDTANAKVFGELSFKDLLAEIYRNERKVSPELKTAIMNIQDRDQVIDHMAQLHYLFKPRFTFVKNNNFLSPKAFASLEISTEAITEVKAIRSKLESILSEIESWIHTFDAQISEAVYQEKDHWERVLDSIESVYGQASRSTPDGFTELIKPLITDDYSGHYFELSMDDLASLSFDNVPQTLSRWRETLAQYPNIIKDQQLACLKRLTPFNAPDQELRGLILDLFKAAEIIENCQWLVTSLTDKALTVQIQIQEIKHCLSHLDNAINALEDEEYMAFRMLQHNLDLDPAITDFLVHSDCESWEDAFVRICMEVDLQENYNPDLRKLHSLYDQLVSIRKRRLEAVLSFIHNNWSDRRRNALDTLQSRHPQIFNELFNLRESYLPFIELIETAPYFMGAFFPLMVCRQSEFQNIVQKSDNWSHWIVVNADAMNQAMMDEYREQHNTITLINDDEVILDFSSEKHMVLKHQDSTPRPIYIKPFSLCDQSEKLWQAKAIASGMTTVLDTYNIYKLGQLTIISCLPSLMDQVLKDSLPHQKLNILYEDKQGPDELIEALLLSEDGVCLLYENGMINDKKSGCIDWQRELLKSLGESEVALIEVNTNHFYQNFDKACSDIVNKIVNLEVVREKSKTVLI